jgi:hypothetical protein
MTPKSLFNIILKIVGIFFIINIIEIAGELISTIAFMSSPDSFDPKSNIFIFSGSIVILAIYIFITYQLLFNTKNILNKLKLDRGFTEEQFSFNISEGSILRIALIVIAGVILINEIPNFCNAVYQYIQQKIIQSHSGTKPSVSYLILHGVKIVLALLILGERRRIAAFAESKPIVEVDTE